ncbi:MAG: ABC transporter permease [Anaerolineales bacterium]|nr:ABC transporter permease [Anaerolineales bacterium]
MNKIWIIAKNTYKQRIRSSTFLLITFGLPLVMVVAGAIPIITELRGELPDIGYVDETGQMVELDAVEVEGETLSLAAYRTRETAESDLKSGEIAGALIFPEDYFKGGTPLYLAAEEPNEKLKDGLSKMVRKGMFADSPSWQVDRWEEKANFTYLAVETGKSISEGPAVFLRVGIPIFLAFVFVLAIFTGANQMGSVVVMEKEERAMEMVITSISPRELISGKVFGMTLLSSTQVSIWILAASSAVFLFFRDDLIGKSIAMPWEAMIWAVLLCVPGYFLFALIGAGLGIIAGDMEQARQLSGMLGFIGMGPMYLMGVVVNAVDGPLAVGLTLFPFTAPTLSLFRMALTDVPTWQLAASFLILILCLLGSIWFVARIFRVTMLLYGQKLTLKQILQALSASGGMELKAVKEQNV